ncbi:MAG: SAM-dependent methyltransferase [Planctomycetota bacterium]|jgi:SAM-dependent methyltransferase
MEQQAYHDMAALEDHHWWFKGKRRLIAPLLDAALTDKPDSLVVDIGCGTGSNLTLVHDRFPKARQIGVDMDASALGYCTERGESASLVRASGLALPIESGSADCVVALDFIEHVDDDLALITEFARILRPGGSVVASVPAYPSLWSPHDAFMHHKRRYRSGELEQRFAEAGLVVDRRYGFNFVLLPIIAAVRALKRNSKQSSPEGSSDFFELPGPIDAIVHAAMAGVFWFESLAVRLLPIRFGVSFMLKAHRPR